VTGIMNYKTAQPATHQATTKKVCMELDRELHKFNSITYNLKCQYKHDRYIIDGGLKNMTFVLNG
jgi:hypothetical protein